MDSLNLTPAAARSHDAELIRRLLAFGGPATVHDLFGCAPRWAVESLHRCRDAGLVERHFGDRFAPTFAGRKLLGVRTPSLRT